MISCSTLIIPFHGYTVQPVEGCPQHEFTRTPVPGWLLENSTSWMSPPPPGRCLILHVFCMTGLQSMGAAEGWVGFLEKDTIGARWGARDLPQTQHISVNVLHLRDEKVFVSCNGSKNIYRVGIGIKKWIFLFFSKESVLHACFMLIRSWKGEKIG